MSVVAFDPMPAMSLMRRALDRQGVGGRAKAVRNRLIARLAGVCLLAVVFSVIQVWSRIKVLDLRYALTEVQKRIDQMEQQRHRLDLRIAAMTEPERLERVGREVLGLQQPAPGQIVFVREVTDGADLAASTSGQ